MFLNIKEKFVCISMLLLSQTIQKNIQHEADLSTEAWNTIQSAFFRIPEMVKVPLFHKNKDF